MHSPTDIAGARTDRAVECALLRIDLDGVHWRAQTREASKTTEVNVKSIGFTDCTGLREVRLFGPAVLGDRSPGSGDRSPSAVAALDMVVILITKSLNEEVDAELIHDVASNNANPELPKIVGKTVIEVQPFEMVVSPTLVRLLMKFKAAASSGGARPMAPMGIRCDVFLKTMNCAPKNQGFYILKMSVQAGRSTEAGLQVRILH